MTKQLFVRINPRAGIEKFFRCGIAFGPAWQLVANLDAATAQRLHDEQMLEVSATEPEGYVPEVDAEADAKAAAEAQAAAEAEAQVKATTSKKR